MPFESTQSAIKTWTTLGILNSFEYPIKYDYFSYLLNLSSILANSFEMSTKEIPANSLYTISFEDLVNSPREEMVSIFKFLQLESPMISEVCYENIKNGIYKSNIRAS